MGKNERRRPAGCINPGGNVKKAELTSDQAAQAKFSRRTLMITTAGAAVGGLGIGAGVEHFMPILLGGNPLVKNDEGGEKERDLEGKKLEGGEIVTEPQLIQLYKDVISSGKSPEIEPTIVNSTLYHAMRFFGLDEELARKRAMNVSISSYYQDPGACGGGACTYDSRTGLGVELTDTTFPSGPEFGGAGWFVGLTNLAHEAAHISVDKVSDFPEVENYGVIGTSTIVREQRGFYGVAVYSGIAGGLMEKYEMLDNRQMTSIFSAEEFMADVSKKMFFDHLLENGLRGTMYADYGYPSGYTNLSFGISNMINNPEVFGRGLSIHEIMALHRQNKRLEFFERLGENIIHSNPNGVDGELDQGDIAGLGLVGFTDFAYVPFQSAQGLYLSNKFKANPISKELIESAGLDLNSRIMSQG